MTVPGGFAGDRLCVLHYTLFVEQECAEMRRESALGKNSHERQNELMGKIADPGEALVHVATSGFPMSDELNRARIIEALVALTLSLSTPVFAAESIKINDLVVATAIPDAQRDATMKAVRAFYDFWNTGDEALLQEAIAPNFTDHTLPSGRPQGPEGPAFASRRFRAAVPDLKVTVEKMIVAGD